MKKIVVLGVTSGIAAYKTLELIQELKRDDVAVSVVMSRSATRMVDQKDFEKASGNKVYSELFEENFDYKHILQTRKVDHIALADSADVICIAPATANTIAKIAHGIADDFLTTMVLAASSPLIICPSMNVHMWNNPAVKENIKILERRGCIIIPPEKGQLACGYEGAGRLPHILKIKKEILGTIAYSSSLRGKTVLVSAGPTKEYIDDVRFITNNSSGKMGIALADECHLRGANVILLKAEGTGEPRYMYQTDVFETAEDLRGQLERYVPEADMMFHSAAVGDFTFEKKQGKLSSNTLIDVVLTPQKKLSSQIKLLNEGIFLILFKAEWGLSEKALIEKAREKLYESNADVVIANDISKKDRGFRSDTNEVTVVTKNDSVNIPLLQKQEVSSKILDVLSVHFPQEF